MEIVIILIILAIIVIGISHLYVNSGIYDMYDDNEDDDWSYQYINKSEDYNDDSSDSGGDSGCDSDSSSD